jgi:hypothetical protein
VSIGANILREVRANQARLDECRLHQFEPRKVRVGERVTCKNCQGSMSLVHLGSYISGYEASGKSADDIWPGWRTTT